MRKKEIKFIFLNLIIVFAFSINGCVRKVNNQQNTSHILPSDNIVSNEKFHLKNNENSDELDQKISEKASKSSSQKNDINLTTNNKTTESQTDSKNIKQPQITQNQISNSSTSISNDSYKKTNENKVTKTEQQNSTEKISTPISQPTSELPTVPKPVQTPLSTPNEAQPSINETNTSTPVADVKNTKTTNTTDNPPINDASIVTGNMVTEYASSFLGTPYLWGGNTLKGFDYSGFVQYVYAHFNITVGRTVFDQLNVGTKVSKDELLPGDIIFFGSETAPHVDAIYMGNNNFIAAETKGVSIEPMTRDDYATARRVIK